MKRPWQFWLLFALGVGLVVLPLAWLSVKSLELDRKELAARQKIGLEERINRALWRMDVLLMPLIAQEASRPEFVYRPSVSVLVPTGKGESHAAQAVSPLLLSRPDYVLVHFELRPDGTLSSPQCPEGTEASWAMSNGASADVMRTARACLDQLAGQLDHADLLSQLPEESLPPIDTGTPPWNSVVSSLDQAQIVTNTFEQAQLQEPQPAQSAQSKDRPRQQADAPSADARDPTGQTLLPPQQPEGLFTANRSGRNTLRTDNDLQSRGQAFQALAQRTYQQQRYNYANVDPAEAPAVVEGVSQAIWVGPRLILARRVKSGADTVIQGCWLDWEQLEQRLLAEVRDLELPQVRLTPVVHSSTADQSHLLVTVPVELSVGAPPVEPAWDSPIRISLVAAWSCLFLAVICAAMTLRSVVALSERRAAFVSAVTHELRTPLTTFRMYAEMLAEGMVRSAEQRQKYLQTLRREADRLSHLVENVLAYARLERGRCGRQRERLTLGALLDRIVPRLEDRAAQAEMKLVVEVVDEARGELLATDGGAIEQILFNLVDNACKYASGGGDLRIHLEASADPRCVTMRVRDHGPGISRQQRRRLFLPFSKSVQEAARTAPGVGLGLSLSRRLARQLGGRLVCDAGDGPGAAFVLMLPR
jgi:signal transduction histidine kinase